MIQGTASSLAELAVNLEWEPPFWFRFGTFSKGEDDLILDAFHKHFELKKPLLDSSEIFLIP